MTTEYMVLYKIGGAGDPEVWLPGSTIQLDEEKARLYLDAGLVRAIETTRPMSEPTPTTVVHEPTETPAESAETPTGATRRNRKKDGE